jgi:hypothetical protein|tara:strand:- start:128 stop:283 length:156 start_codon:yes stop_codon:yes gene_type:complete
MPFSDEISNKYDWLIDRNIHYPTMDDIFKTFDMYKVEKSSEFFLERQSFNN